MRYLPLTAADRRSMLDAIGVKSVDELYRDVPSAARREGLVDRSEEHTSELQSP